MPRNGLVTTDDPERKAEAGAGKRDRAQKKQGQKLPEDLILADVEEDVPADLLRHVDFVPGDELADHLAEAEGEDDEVDARQP